MRRRHVALLAIAAVLAAPAVSSALGHPGSKLCGQRPGPYASYLSRVSGFKSRGKTWTVIATPASLCRFALAHLDTLLGEWKRAKLGAQLALPGYTCVKMVDTGYGGAGTASGGFLCHRGKTPAPTIFDANSFTARESAPYSAASIRALFGIT
jgi:hypothetical protein